MEERNYDWQEGEFGAYSWHDNRIRGIRFRSPLEGYECDLILEIDYITQWIKQDNTFRFAVAPALLIFHDAADIEVDLGLSFKEDVDIDSVSREDIANEVEKKHGISKFRFAVSIQGFREKANRIELTASGFELKLLGEPAVQTRQRRDDPPLDAITE